MLYDLYYLCPVTGEETRCNNAPLPESEIWRCRCQFGRSGQYAVEPFTSDSE